MENNESDRPVGASQHPNDMYGNIDARSEDDSGVAPPIPAATVVLLRDGDAGIEVLMLKKNSKITFGGMWVFPGGKIDAEDYPVAGDVDAAARIAAARETQEEAGLSVSAEAFVQIAACLLLRPSFVLWTGHEAYLELSADSGPACATA